MTWSELWTSVHSEWDLTHRRIFSNCNSRSLSACSGSELPFPRLPHIHVAVPFPVPATFLSQRLPVGVFPEWCSVASALSTVRLQQKLETPTMEWFLSEVFHSPRHPTDLSSVPWQNMDYRWCMVYIIIIILRFPVFLQSEVFRMFLYNTRCWLNSLQPYVGRANSDGFIRRDWSGCISMTYSISRGMSVGWGPTRQGCSCWCWSCRVHPRPRHYASLLTLWLLIWWLPIRVMCLCQSCPRVTFLGPDPTRWNVDPTRPDPRLLTKFWPDLTRPATRLFPHMYSLQLNNYLLIK